MNKIVSFVIHLMRRMPHENISSERRESQVEHLSESIKMRFREDNRLDYLIYDYCLKKLDYLNRNLDKLLSQSDK